LCTFSGVQVTRIADGLWRICVAHPALEGESVASTYVETASAVVMIDPLVPPADSPDGRRFHHHLQEDLARAGRPLAIALTTPRHARSAAELRHRYAERLLSEDAGLPEGLVAVPVNASELALYAPGHRALVVGDAIAGAGGGEVRVRRPDPGLTALLELDVEIVLPAHGEPVLTGGAAALRRALDGGR
jgi:hypothetical protein